MERLRLQSHQGAVSNFHWQRIHRFSLPLSCDAAARSSVGEQGAVCRTLSRPCGLLTTKTSIDKATHIYAYIPIFPT